MRQAEKNGEGPPVVRGRPPGPRCAVPLNQALTPRASGPVLVGWKRAPASWWRGEAWSENERIWGRRGLRVAKTKIGLFPGLLFVMQ